MIGRAALPAFVLRRCAPARIARFSYAAALVAAFALGATVAHAQSGFVLRADALTSAGGSSSAGAHFLGMSLGQTFTGASTGGSHAEHAGMWRPGIDPRVSVDPGPIRSLPTRVELLAISPNPTRGPMHFQLGIPAGLPNATVELRIFDLQGRTVRRLRFEHLAPGWHPRSWDGRDSGGGEAGLGVYFCRIDAGDFSASRRFVVIH